MNSQIDAFREKIWEWYRDNERNLPWRDSPTPYEVLVSEVMLQQTQVSRVLVKYREWMQTFPSLETLAVASVADVISAWQGLGYNRRGLWLQRAAQQILTDYDGKLPRDPDVLIKLQGIGPNTAGSLAAFAYNEPVVFIETNIRRVFIHEFFSHQPEGVNNLDELVVSDDELIPLIEATLDHDEPRQWYYALMDYGSWLAKNVPNPNRRSKHYTLQSKFEGSSRQVRGEILRRALVGSLSEAQVKSIDDRALDLAQTLVKEGFLQVVAGQYQMVR